VSPIQTVILKLEKGDHWELDRSEILGINDVKKYQSLIESLHWAVSLGSWDVATAVMTMSNSGQNPNKDSWIESR